MSDTATPLMLVAGGDAALKVSLLAHWIRTRPAGERWAVLAEGGLTGAGLAAELAEAVESGESVEAGEAFRVVPVGGCPCCSGALMLRVKLTRLLREGGWQRVVILASAAAEMAPLRSLLGEQQFARHLALDHVVVVDGAQPGQAPAAGVLPFATMVVRPGPAAPRWPDWAAVVAAASAADAAAARAP